MNHGFGVLEGLLQRVAGSRNWRKTPAADRRTRPSPFTWYFHVTRPCQDTSVPLTCASIRRKLSAIL
jgi:hypothetical protein